MITQDYKGWLERIDFDLDDRFAEVYRLYRTIKDVDGDYGVSFRMEGENMLVRYPPDSDFELLLTPEKRNEFAIYLDSLFELGVDGEWSMRQAMGQNN